MTRLLATIMALTLTPTIALCADWPNFRGPAQDNISREGGWNAKSVATPRILWRAAVGNGFSTVSVANGRVYTMGNRANRDTVWCLDQDKGTVLWQHTYDAPAMGRGSPDFPGPRSTPTVDGEVVYTLSRDGQLFCLNVADGKPRWSVNILQLSGAELPDWGFSSSPFVVGNMLIINAGSSGLALNKTDGSVIWKSATGMAGYNTPILFEQGGRQLLAFSNADSVVCVEAATGKLLWSIPWPTSWKVNAADLIYSDGKFFVSSGYNRGCALFDITGPQPRELWRNREIRNMFTTSILLDGHIYGVDGDQEGGQGEGVKCIEWATGKARWAEKSLRFCPFVIADGKLVILQERGELIIAEASPQKYTELARAQVLGGASWVTPVLANGRIYVRNNAGDLACVDVR